MHLSGLLHHWNEQVAPGQEVLASPAISKGFRTAMDNQKVKFRERKCNARIDRVLYLSF